MSILSAIMEVGKTIVDTVSAAAVALTEKIGGAVMRSVTNFIKPLPALFPSPQIGLLLNILNVIIPAVADALTTKPREEKPERLGRQAEIAYEENHAVPEDFSSTEEYIQYLREEIHVKQGELEAMSDEERMKYAEIGSALYVRDMEEKYGVSMEPEFWRAAAASQMGNDRVSTLIPILRENGVSSGRMLDDYFAGRLEPGAPEREKVSNALMQAVGRSRGSSEIAPVRGEINQYVRNYNGVREE